MFLWRFTWGLGCFNVLTSEIVFKWVVIRLKVIVAIFATFLSTELYAFEVPVISYNKFSEGKTRKNCKTIHVVCFSSAMLCIQTIIFSITYDDDNWYTYCIRIESPFHDDSNDPNFIGNF